MIIYAKYVEIRNKVAMLRNLQKGLLHRCLEIHIISYSEREVANFIQSVKVT